MSQALHDILEKSVDASGPVKTVSAAVLRDHFDRALTRRLKVQSATFLCLMGIGALVPNLEQMVEGIDGLRAILLMLVCLGFPLSWWVQARRAVGWSLQKKTEWARRYDFGNLVSVAAALALILFTILARAGILPFPSRGALLLCSLGSVPVLALALHWAQKRLARLLDPDWLE